MDIHTDQFTFSQNLNLDFALWKEARLMLGENYSTGGMRGSAANRKATTIITWASNSSSSRRSST